MLEVVKIWKLNPEKFLMFGMRSHPWTKLFGPFGVVHGLCCWECLGSNC